MIDILLRLLVPGAEGLFLAFGITLFHMQFWPDDLTGAQFEALRKGNRWVMIMVPIFAVIFNWRVDLRIPFLWSPE